MQAFGCPLPRSGWPTDTKEHFCKGELLYNASTCLKPGGFPACQYYSAFRLLIKVVVICISLQVGKKMGQILKGVKENKTPTPSARWWK